MNASEKQHLRSVVRQTCPKCDAILLVRKHGPTCSAGCGVPLKDKIGLPWKYQLSALWDIFPELRQEAPYESKSWTLNTPPKTDQLKSGGGKRKTKSLGGQQSMFAGE